MHYYSPDQTLYATGMLGVGGGQHIYWECCGKSDGKPAIVFTASPVPAVRRGIEDCSIRRSTASCFSTRETQSAAAHTPAVKR
jgi:hypothetical protein